MVGEDDRLAREGLDEDVGQLQALRQRQRALERAQRRLAVPCECMHAAELRERPNEYGIRLPSVEPSDGVLEAGRRLV